MSDYIPEGNLVNIFKCLPVKILLRLRCVCKWWKELIDSPTFLQEHLAVQKPRFFVECEDPEFLVLDPHPQPSVTMLRGPIEGGTIRFSFLGTLHGVVLLYDEAIEVFMLWNPSIRRFSSLPRLMGFQCAIHDRWKICHGFWIDPSNKEFKIIILLFRRGMEDLIKVNYRMEDAHDLQLDGFLYSSIRRDWSVIPPGDVGRNWMPWKQSPPVIIGGVLVHWGGWYKNTKTLLSYDFKQESFGFIELPNLEYFSSYNPRIFHWQGALSLLYWDCSRYPYKCDIYSRREDSWVNMFGFNILAHIADVFWPLEERGRALVEKRDDLFVTRLVLYDTGEDCIPSAHLCGRIVCVTYDFVESLLFPW